MTRLLSLNAESPAASVLAEAVAILQRGGIVAYPTDTIYGLAVDATQTEAVARLYTVKGRPLHKAMPIIIGALSQLSRVAAEIPPQAVQLITAFWPGPLTLLLAPHAQLSPWLMGDSPCIGVRWPLSIVSQQLALQLGCPITATSANRSGHAGALTAADVAAQLTPGVDLILDAGPLTNPVASTVLDMTVDPPRLHRHGRISSHAIEAVLGCRVTQKKVDTSE